MKLKLLLEINKIVTQNELIKAIERGQIQGISVKKFFSKIKDFSKNTIIENSFKVLLRRLKEINFGDNHNLAISILLKKIGNGKDPEELKKDILEIIRPDYLDSLKSYFNNWKKQEFKTDPEVQKKTEKYLNGPINYIKDKKYEQFINDKFIKSSKTKSDKELGKVYGPDEEGWEIFIPKTFAAAVKLACMKNRKAKWCTSANPSFFINYRSSKKLHIIRNEKKDIMYQMNWDYDNPNFRNEDDTTTSIKTFLKQNPTDGLLNFLKNPYKKNKTLKSYLEKYKKGLKKGKKETLISVDNWKIEKLNTMELTKEIGDLKRGPYIDAITEIEDLFKKSYLEKNKKYYKISSPKETYFIVEKRFFKIDNKNPKNSNELKPSIFKGAKKIPFEIRKIIFPEITKKEFVGKPKHKEEQLEKTEFKIIRPKNFIAIKKIFPKFFNRLMESEKKTKSSNIMIIIYKHYKYGFVKSNDGKSRGIFTSLDEIYNDGFFKRLKKGFMPFKYFSTYKIFPRKMLNTINEFFETKEIFKGLRQSVKEKNLEILFSKDDAYIKINNGEKRRFTLRIQLNNYFIINILKDGKVIKSLFLKKGDYPKIYNLLKNKSLFDFVKDRMIRTAISKKRKEEKKETPEEWRKKVKNYLKILRNEPVGRNNPRRRKYIRDLYLNQ